MSSFISKDILRDAASTLKDHKILVVGDIMLDRYIFGNVERISPEAPVPVVRAEYERHHLGGAGNVAMNIKALGGEPILIGISGDDTDAALLGTTLEQSEIPYTLLTDPTRPTIVKTRVIAQGQQVVRIDRESLQKQSTVLTQSIIDALAKSLDEVSTIIISDYAKGLVTEDFLQALGNIKSKSQRPLNILVDPKPKHFSLYSDAFLLTPNLVEAESMVHLNASRDLAGIQETGRRLLQQVSCENLLVTLGAEGMFLFENSGKEFHISAMAQSVYDVTGAGDTVIAMIGLSVAAGHPLLICSMLANYAAGVVVGKIGAASTNEEEMIEAIQRWNFPHVTQWS